MDTIKSYLWLICFAVGLTGGWLSNGWRLNGTIEAIHRGYAYATTKASEDARKLEQERQATVDGLKANLEKEKKNAETKIARLNADLAAGRVRLTIPVTTCGTGTGSGIRLDETRFELDGEAAQSLVSIAADGDAAIRELNYCIDAYSALRD